MSQPSVPTLSPTPEPAEATAAIPSDATGKPGMRERAARIVLAIAILASIAGAAWYVGERQGWAQIGRGGINAALLPKVGEEAPELFTLRADGTPVLLSQLRGQAVWINFWGSWCPPCRSEMPELQRAYQTLAPQGLQMLAVSMQEPLSDAVNYANSVGATIPIYADPNQVASLIDPQKNPRAAQMMALMTQDWQIVNFPTHIFIDAEGIVRAVVISPMSYEEAVGYGEMVLNANNQPSS